MIPSLIHPVDVEVRQLDEAGTAKDPDTGEVLLGDGRYGGDVGERYGDPITLAGQVKWGATEVFVPAAGGEVPDSKGHVVFRVCDLETAGVTLRKRDKITAIAGTEYELWITELRPQAHYGGRPTLIFAVFNDSPLGG